jgi:hypothetical protein
MSTPLLIILNLMMSLLAVGAVAAGALIACRLKPAPDSEGRAGWRGPIGGIAHLLSAHKSAASIATATNSSAR